MFKNNLNLIYHRIKDMPLMSEHTDGELMKCIITLLEGIFSQQVTPQEYEVIKPLFLEYFSIISNIGNASERLAFFKIYLQYILALLMSGFADEE